MATTSPLAAACSAKRVMRQFNRDNSKARTGQGIRLEVADAFVNIIKAVERSGMAERSRELDDYRSKPYWATKVEMAARAFEAWVKFTLEANDQSNDYLANIGSGMAGSDMLAAVLSGAWHSAPR